MKGKNHQKNQNGLASIIIVMTIITLLTLITVGFSTLMNKEYRQSIDRELASQANYAVESGLNDARAYVVAQNKLGNDPSTPPNQCLDLNHNPLPSNLSEFIPYGSISGLYANPSGGSTDNTVKYTCVFINTHPYDLNFDIKKGESRVFEVVPSSTLNNLYFSWQNQSSATFVPLTPYNLPKETAITTDNETGLLRATLYPAVNSSDATGNTSSDIQNNAVAAASRTYFMYPNANKSKGQKGQARYNVSTQQGFLNGECNGGNNVSTGPLPYKENQFFCNSKIINLAAGPQTFNYMYVRLTALYQNLRVTVEGTDASDNPVKLNNAQAVIDVTGEGNDILKRQVGRLSLSDIYDLPNDALQSMDSLCKKQRLPKNSPGGYDNAVLDPSEVSPNGVDGACRL